jgi:hypothetical protein
MRQHLKHMPEVVVGAGRRGIGRLEGGELVFRQPAKRAIAAVRVGV